MVYFPARDKKAFPDVSSVVDGGVCKTSAAQRPQPCFPFGLVSTEHSMPQVFLGIYHLAYEELLTHARLA